MNEICVSCGKFRLAKEFRDGICYTVGCPFPKMLPLMVLKWNASVLIDDRRRAERERYYKNHEDRKKRQRKYRESQEVERESGAYLFYKKKDPAV